MIDRRTFLSSTGLAALGVAAFGASARAFQIQPMPTPVRDTYNLRCSGDASADHARLIQEAEARLASTAERDAFRARLASLLPVGTCPVCGCPLTLAAISPAASTLR